MLRLFLSIAISGAIREVHDHAVTSDYYAISTSFVMFLPNSESRYDDK